MPARRTDALVWRS
ncbi:hypothetical protein LINPERPRIM_LOCUS31692 [Linum perenne]